MSENFGPVDPKQLHNRPGGPRPVGEAPLTEPEKTRLAGTVVRGLVAGLSMLFLSPTEDQSLKRGTDTVSIQPKSPWLDIQGAQESLQEKSVREIRDWTLSALDSQDIRKSIPLLNPETPILKLCEVGVPFLRQHVTDMVNVWEYLVKHFSEWKDSPEIRTHLFNRMREKKFKGKNVSDEHVLQSVTTSLQNIDEVLNKCRLIPKGDSLFERIGRGIAQNIASAKKGEIDEGQKRALVLTAAFAEFLYKKSNDAEAAPVVEALMRIKQGLENAR